MVQNVAACQEIGWAKKEKSGMEPEKDGMCIPLFVKMNILPFSSLSNKNAYKIDSSAENSATMGVFCMPFYTNCSNGMKNAENPAFNLTDTAEKSIIL